MLVVEADPGMRAKVATWLEAEGYGVLSCPGPTGPDYTCTMGRCGRCALAEAADLVVLDTGLDSSSLMEGTSPDELLAGYLALDLPVVLLRREGFDLIPPDARVRIVRWSPERRSLLVLVRDLLLPSSRGQRAPGAPPQGARSAPSLLPLVDRARDGSGRTGTGRSPGHGPHGRGHWGV